MLAKNIGVVRRLSCCWNEWTVIPLLAEFAMFCRACSFTSDFMVRSGSGCDGTDAIGGGRSVVLIPVEKGFHVPGFRLFAL